MSSAIWKNDEARQRLEEWHERFASKIPGPVERRDMPTRHGPSHVLIAGPPQATPIVCLHAMRTGSAHLLSELPDLVRRFRLIAPDLPDQSVRGLQLRLPMAGHAQADWLQDILDGFGLDQVNLFGVSWGGFVARQTASAFPTRIRRLALLVPAGIANGSHWKGLTKMAWPLLRYRLRRTDQNLRRLLEPLITTWDVDWSAYMADTLRYLRTDLRIPPLATDDELRRLTMPVLALGAEHDLSFPGEAVVRRIRAIAPKAEGEVIPDCKHCPPTTPEFRKWLADRLTSFFSGPA